VSSSPSGCRSVDVGYSLPAPLVGYHHGNRNIWIEFLPTHSEVCLGVYIGCATSSNVVDEAGQG
jgi:hypothetical protein